MAVTGRLIAQVANFYGPQSGGLRTTVDMLGHGYVQAGYDRVLVVPGPRDADEETPSGRRITLRAPAVPGGSGYRFLPDWRRVAAVLDRCGVDRLEVSDKLTLWPLGPWASRHHIPSVLLSHERLDAIVSPRLPKWLPPSALTLATDRCNRRLADSFPTIVSASRFSCEEWYRVGADDVIRVPLGVDLATFSPPSPSAHGRSPGAPAQVVCIGRLSREKRPDLAVAALDELVDSGVRAELTMVGAGPEARALGAWCRARALPVRFLGHVSERAEVARLLARADAALAPCPVEAFGLSVLEALACGTPVVTTDRGAARELLAPACGVAAAPTGPALAAALTTVLGWPRAWVTASARRRAERFPWSATVAAMLAAHDLPIRKGAAA